MKQNTFNLVLLSILLLGYVSCYNSYLDYDQQNKFFYEKVLNQFRQSVSATNMVRLYFEYETSVVDLGLSLKFYTLGCNYLEHETLLYDEPTEYVPALSYLQLYIPYNESDPYHVQRYFQTYLQNLATDGASYYDFENKTCSENYDCLPYLNLIWHKLQFFRCQTNICYDQLNENQEYQTFNQFICAFTEPPHPENDIFVNDPYTKTDSTHAQASNCPTHAPYNDFYLCDHVSTSCADGRKDETLYCPDHQLLCQDEKEILADICAYTCQNCDNSLYSSDKNVTFCSQGLQDFYCLTDYYSIYNCPALCTKNFHSEQFSQTEEIQIMDLLNSFRQDLRNLGKNMMNLHYTELVASFASTQLSSLIMNPTDLERTKHYLINAENQDYMDANSTFSYTIGSDDIQYFIDDLLSWRDLYYNQTDPTCDSVEDLGEKKICKDFLNLLYEGYVHFGCAKSFDINLNEGFFFCYFTEYTEHNYSSYAYQPISFDNTTNLPGLSSQFCAGHGQSFRLAYLCQQPYEVATTYVPQTCYNSQDDLNSTLCASIASTNLCWMYPGLYQPLCPRTCNNCYQRYCQNSQMAHHYLDSGFNCDLYTTSDCQNNQELSFVCPILCGVCTASNSNFDEQSRQNIVAVLNTYARVQNYTWSTNMLELEWDPQLELKAHKYINQPSDCVNIGQPSFFTYQSAALHLKQNLSTYTGSYDTYSFNDFKAVVDDWLAQVLNFNFTSNSCKSGLSCENFQAILVESANKVGCAFRDCDQSDTRLLLCYFQTVVPIGSAVWNPTTFYNTCSLCANFNFSYCNDRVCSHSNKCTDILTTCESEKQQNSQICSQKPWYTTHACRLTCNNCAGNQCFDSSNYNCNTVNCTDSSQSQYCPAKCNLCPPI